MLYIDKLCTSRSDLVFRCFQTAPAALFGRRGLHGPHRRQETQREDLSLGVGGATTGGVTRWWSINHRKTIGKCWFLMVQG